MIWRTLAIEARSSIVEYMLSKSMQQPGLANTRLAADKKDLAAASSYALPPLAQVRHLASPSYQSALAVAQGAKTAGIGFSDTSDIKKLDWLGNTLQKLGTDRFEREVLAYKPTSRKANH
jgi:hypothetical protein